MIDDKLLEILLKADFTPGLDLAHTSEKYGKVIAQIKQAFKDEGYIKIPPLVKSTSKVFEIKKGGIAITIKPEEVMTGQEWLSRFEKELMDIPVLWTDEIPKQLNPYALKVLEAAKKASGL